MSYQINQLAHFLIDGSELNAGERAFLRTNKTVVIDGATVGTASDRMFLKDAVYLSIDGGILSTDRAYLGSAPYWVITGRPASEQIYAQPQFHVIDVRPGVNPVIALRTHYFSIIEDVPQEEPPT